MKRGGLTLSDWNKVCPSCSKPDVWPKIWSSQMCCSQSPYIRLQHFKVVSRWYMTLERLGYFKADSSIKCWKGYDQKGTYFHCQWLCSMVQKLIAHQIYKITSLDIPCTPEIILLDYWNNSQISAENCFQQRTDIFTGLHPVVCQQNKTKQKKGGGGRSQVVSVQFIIIQRPYSFCHAGFVRGSIKYNFALSTNNIRTP